MGQQLGREEDGPGLAERTTGTNHRRTTALAGLQRDPLASSRKSTSASAARSGGSTTSKKAHAISSQTRVDQGYVVPQGIYRKKAEYEDDLVRKLIVERKLSPFFRGVEEEDEMEQDTIGHECPICFMPICTECFVQIQRVDPAKSKPPASEPAACPFCMTPNFGVVYNSASTSQGDAKDAIEAAATAIGRGGAQSSQRVSYEPDDPAVVLVDQIHPNWKEKLERALATSARQANRRVIMRQDGERLVPIGVSSSLTGDALAQFVDQHSEVGHSGPGGSIILHGDVLEQQIQQRLNNESERVQFRRAMDRRNPEIGDELARTLSSFTPRELEEMMVRETMRISRMEYEQQQQQQQEQQGQGHEQRQRSHSMSEATTSKSSSRRLSFLPKKIAQSAQSISTSPLRLAQLNRTTQRASMDISLPSSSSQTPEPRTSIDVASLARDKKRADSMPTQTTRATLSTPTSANPLAASQTSLPSSANGATMSGSVSPLPPPSESEEMTETASTQGSVSSSGLGASTSIGPSKSTTSMTAQSGLSPAWVPSSALSTTAALPASSRTTPTSSSVYMRRKGSGAELELELPAATTKTSPASSTYQRSDSPAALRSSGGPTTPVTTSHAASRTSSPFEMAYTSMLSPAHASPMPQRMSLDMDRVPRSNTLPWTPSALPTIGQGKVLPPSTYSPTVPLTPTIPTPPPPMTSATPNESVRMTPTMRDLEGLFVGPSPISQGSDATSSMVASPSVSRLRGESTNPFRARSRTLDSLM
ncbi:hypothetical protein Malapachy_2857 [Malassezia pachydermatis]|uniref:RING-type domain-containing protein n=1 Tax=Malassezia pachydermatis TaxID=77020 RepID=A0A0M9VMR0_9BASI|nr:hypothetical protein Malapachy_2857 [Malassezia pachydermatis]KOS12525.1 hypothetical protein Malapachy_2857 [Malassezia pachydermatis]